MEVFVIVTVLAGLADEPTILHSSTSILHEEGKLLTFSSLAECEKKLAEQNGAKVGMAIGKNDYGYLSYYFDNEDGWHDFNDSCTPIVLSEKD